MSEQNKARFGSAILCDSAAYDDSGKVNCRGVFTSFLVWAYPTSMRIWHAVVTIYGLPPGTSSVSIAISCGRGKKTTIATADIERSKKDLGHIINVKLRYQFKKEGYCYLHFNLIGTTKTLKIPLKITTQPWPMFTKKEIEFLKKNRSKVGLVRTNIICSACSSPYVFEDVLYSDYKLAQGAHPFPDSGKFECETCSHLIYLKDIQGQVRSSIKTNLSQTMKGGF